MGLQRCVFHARTSHHSEAEKLHPLSVLEHSDPQAFAQAIAKYDDTPERRRLRETWIPVIEARWTEVVFLSAVQPHAIWRAWRDVAGVELAPQEFWAIPVDEVTPAIVLDRYLSRTGDPIEAGEIAELDPSAYRSSTVTTARNEEWIAELSAAGKRGAWFHGTAHVLTRGPVPLASATVIDWSAP